MFEDFTPFIIALVVTFSFMICIAVWNSINAPQPPEKAPPIEPGPSRTREILARFSEFYMNLNLEGEMIFDIDLLPDPKQHIIHALYVGYDESENDEDRKAIKSGLEAIVQFQDLIGDEPLKPEIDEDTEDQQTNLENSDITDEQKKYLDFNNKRIQELETHFSHLKIEMNETVLSEEKIDASDKRNISE